MTNKTLIESLLASSDNQNIIGCLINCSSQGLCQLESLTGKFKCLCNQGFTGSKCDISLKPCSFHPCMNSGQCIEGNNLNDYICNCSSFFTGLKCEIKLDICLNETCSYNGYCIDVAHEPKCKCYNLYSGDKCQIKSSELNIIKITKTISLAVAIGSFSLVALVVFILDLNCCKEKMKKRKVIKSYNDPAFVKPIYKNFN